jgi:hypothetical protein
MNMKISVNRTSVLISRILLSLSSESDDNAISRLTEFLSDYLLLKECFELGSHVEKFLVLVVVLKKVSQINA